MVRGFFNLVGLLFKYMQNPVWISRTSCGREVKSYAMIRVNQLSWNFIYFSYYELYFYRQSNILHYIKV